MNSSIINTGHTPESPDYKGMYEQRKSNKKRSFIYIMAGFKDMPISKDLEHIYGIKPKKAFQGLLGNALMREITPENMDIDLFEHMVKFRPTSNLDIGVGQEGKTNFLNLGWRF